ncbi:YpbF family protein [Paenibacillus sp. P26]|nr:YpbF family protein [Paenibacillus sp. P26]UUZ94296.1 YpbF family protein [Paenibacillus sp. P25]
MDWSDVEATDVTKALIEELVERKQKLDRINRYKNAALIVSSVTLLIIVYYLFRMTHLPGNNDMMRSLHVVTGSHSNLVLFTSWIALYAVTLNLIQMHTKHKAKYEALRTEAIDYMLSPWIKTKSSTQKDLIAAKLKKLHNININYKNK